MEEKYIVAFEIGSSKIRGALASYDAAGVLNILAVDEERHTDSVRYGQVKNIEEVSNMISSICQKLAKTKNIAPRKIEGAYVGLSGLSIGMSDSSETIYFDGETEITAEIISKLKEKTIDTHFSEKDNYEIVPNEYFVDNESTMNPKGRVGTSIKGNFKIIEGNAGIKSNLNRVFPERLGLAINGYIVSALAEAEIVLSAEEKQLGCMFVDFGAETTTVMIFKGGVPRKLVTLPMGSRNITRDLVSLNMLEEQAESIKRAVGIVSQSEKNNTLRFTAPQISDQPEIANYIQARAGEIIANVVAQIEYAGLKAADLPKGIIIVGGGARMKGFSDLLAEQSKMSVRMGTIPRNIRISDASILADDAIDVISLLINVCRNNPRSCISSPVVQQPLYDDYPTGGGKEYVEEDDYDEEGSRIGMEEDDILDDDDDPMNRPQPKKPKKTKNKNKKVDTNSIINSIGVRITKLFRDPEDDRFEDE